MQLRHCTCLSCQSPFLCACPCQQQVPHHHLIAHLIDFDHDEKRKISHLDSKQDWSQLVTIGGFAVHVHVDRDEEKQAFQVTLQEEQYKSWSLKFILYLDDCGVQIIFSPRVWLFSCSRF